MQPGGRGFESRRVHQFFFRAYRASAYPALPVIPSPEPSALGICFSGVFLVMLSGAKPLSEAYERIPCQVLPVPTRGFPSTALRTGESRRVHHSPSPFGLRRTLHPWRVIGLTLGRVRRRMPAVALAEAGPTRWERVEGLVLLPPRVRRRPLLAWLAQFKRRRRDWKRAGGGGSRRVDPS